MRTREGVLLDCRFIIQGRSEGFDETWASHIVRFSWDGDGNSGDEFTFHTL
jgi:hypothetical protein